MAAPGHTIFVWQVPSGLPMQEVLLYDRGRKPANWMELIRPGQYAAFLSDVETGAIRTGAGLPLAAGVAPSCLIFDSLTEASEYCRQRVVDMPNLKCEVFDSHGRVNPPVATFVNPAHQHKLDSPEKYARMMRWGVVAIIASLPFFWIAWARREAWLAIFFGIQVVVLGLRLLHWGYSMREELRYRKQQAELRMSKETQASAKARTTV